MYSEPNFPDCRIIMSLVGFTPLFVSMSAAWRSPGTHTSFLISPSFSHCFTIPISLLSLLSLTSVELWAASQASLLSTMAMIGKSYFSPKISRKNHLVAIDTSIPVVRLIVSAASVELVTLWILFDPRSIGAQSPVIVLTRNMMFPVHYRLHCSDCQSWHL